MTMTSIASLPPALAILGPTASGKTGLALALAADLPVEIISIDSALVYREMDIGTAKPTAAEQAAVPHHLIDLLPPTEAYSAAQFAHDARRCMDDITARGKIPLLVGGTMLYFKALTEGLSDLPQADPALRAALDQEAAERGWPALHAELALRDPLTAARLAPHDAQRIQRALEVCRLSGQAMSALLAASPARAGLPYRLTTLALLPSDRSVLHTRIAQRFEAMLAQDFLAEVQGLLARYPTLHPELPSMRSVGYRQALAYLAGDYDHATLVEKGIVATRQLAKRQLTWLRGMTGLHPLDCLAPELKTHARALCLAGLAPTTPSGYAVHPSTGGE